MGENIEKLFLQICSMGLISGYVILVVLLVRFVLRRFPKQYSYLLWGIVFFRLVCPVGIKSAVSLVPAKFFNVQQETFKELKSDWTPEDGLSKESLKNTEKSPTEDFIAPKDSTEILTKDSTKIVHKTSIQKQIVTPKNLTKKFISVLCAVWLAGLAGIWSVWVYSIYRLKKMLLGAVRIEKGVYETRRISSSFVFGIIHPVIYLAPGLPESAKNYILCHERVHIRRRDYMIKAAALFITGIYWFHPLVWLAYHKMIRDMEMSCDEKVVEQFGESIKKEYSKTLLQMAVKLEQTKWQTAFGGNEVKQRVKNILNYQKPKKWLAVLALLLVAGIGIALGINPEEKSTIASGNEKDNDQDKTVKDIEDQTEGESEKDNSQDKIAKENDNPASFPVGEYHDEMGSQLIISKVDDKNYIVTYGIYKLTYMEEVAGIYNAGSGILSFSGTDDNGNRLSADIAVQGERLTVTLTYSEYSCCPVGEVFEFEPGQPKENNIRKQDSENQPKPGGAGIAGKASDARQLAQNLFYDNWTMWLKEEGMSSSQAVSWYNSVIDSIELGIGNIVQLHVYVKELDKDGTKACFFAVNKNLDIEDRLVQNKSITIRETSDTYTTIYVCVEGDIVYQRDLQGVYLHEFSLLEGDINHDGITEYVWFGDWWKNGSAVEDGGIWSKGILQYKDGNICELEMPGDYRDITQAEAGYYVEVKSTEEEWNCRAAVASQNVSADFRAYNLSGVEDLRGYSSFDIVEKAGMQYLLVKQYLVENKNPHLGIGRACFILDWDKDQKPYIMDFYVETF